MPSPRYAAARLSDTWTEALEVPVSNPPHSQRSTPTRRRAWIPFVTIPLAGLLIVAIAAILGNNLGGDGGSDSVGGSSGAEAICETFVKERLRAPATAEFSGAAVDVVNRDEYLVVGTVDSENGFGALVRTDYECTVRAAGLNKWTLVDLDIN
jgi:hypothetical protein